MKRLCIILMLLSTWFVHQLNAQPPGLIAPDLGQCIISQWAILDSTAYFPGSGGLWKTDGTPAGTTPVKGSPAYTDPIKLNGKLYFPSRIGQYSALWKSDGSDSGAVPVKVFITGNSYIRNLIPLGNKILFTFTNDSGYNAVWSTDGSDSGTIEIKVIAATATHTFLHCGNKVVFLSRQWGNNFYDLWTTDGTTDGTTKVKDSVYSILQAHKVSRYKQTDTLTYFILESFFNSQILWRTDGTKAGTFMLDSGVINSLNNYRDTLYYLKVGELWKSDGSLSGTIRLNWFPQINEIQVIGESLYMQAGTGSDCEPYISNGTYAGTRLLKDINKGISGSYPYSFIAVGNMTCFVAYDSLHGIQIWKTDGSSSGTTMITMIDTIVDLYTYQFRSIGKYLIYSFQGDLYSAYIDTAITTGVEHQVLQEGIKLYPVPSTGILTIEWNDHLISEVEILNLSGVTVKDLKPQLRDRMELNVNDLGHGVYFLRLTDGKQSLVRRFVLR